MLGLIKHRKECVEFYSLMAFKRILCKNFGVKSWDILYNENNNGLTIGDTKWTWTNLASELGWFDDAEIVTDKNEREKVMVWLNVD